MVFFSLFWNSGLKKVDILRLAPVYDIKWSVNLEKRVFAPKKVAYLKYGLGTQSMSVVSRQNLIDFINHRLNQEINTSQSGLKNKFCNVFNVCDKKNYRFIEIIRVFKKSDHQPNRCVLFVPLSFVKLVTRLAGLIFKRKRKWLHSNYDKLACSLVIDNTKMLETGFMPKHSLESVFFED